MGPNHLHLPLQKYAQGWHSSEDKPSPKTEQAVRCCSNLEQRESGEGRNPLGVRAEIWVGPL